jgi:hypothetical protein
MSSKALSRAALVRLNYVQMAMVAKVKTKPQIKKIRGNNDENNLNGRLKKKIEQFMRSDKENGTR